MNEEGACAKAERYKPCHSKNVYILLDMYMFFVAGYNSYGQLGDGSNTEKNVPVRINIDDVVSIFSGAYHSFALKEDGTVWAWGRNEFGQLGDGTTTDKNVPIKIDIEGVTSLSIGHEHSMALKEDGSVWAWGYAVHGELGIDVEDEYKSTPVKVNIEGVTAVSAGDHHNLALKEDGTLWSWGRNYYGQLGNDSNIDSNIPIKVDIDNVKTMSAGTEYSIALKEDGSVWSWGYNGAGQLGDGTNTKKGIPVIANINEIEALSAGVSHTIAVKEDGFVWGWGDNSNGQLGTGDFIDTNLPVQVKGENGVDFLSLKDSGTSIISVTDISLNKTSTNITIGSSETLTATIAPDDATNKNVIWSSSNDNVATVSQSGTVTSVAPGTVTITVRTEDGDKTASCIVTVSEISVIGVSLNKDTTSMIIGSTETLIATVEPENAANKNISWSSSNTNVATVSQSGIVTAIALGTATITVRTEDGDKTASCIVTVLTNPVTEVSLNKTSSAMNVGSTETLVATVLPANATNKTVVWSSSNTNIATVSQSGVVTAIAAGTAIITVRTEDGNKTASCIVTVTSNLVTGVSLNRASTTIIVGSTEILTATVFPANATNKNVVWTSSDDNIATVSQSGTVTAVALGTATITVQTEDGDKTASCVVTVTQMGRDRSSSARSAADITQQNTTDNNQLDSTTSDLNDFNKLTTDSTTEEIVEAVSYEALLFSESDKEDPDKIDAITNYAEEAAATIASKEVELEDDTIHVTESLIADLEDIAVDAKEQIFNKLKQAEIPQHRVTDTAARLVINEETDKIRLIVSRNELDKVTNIEKIRIETPSTGVTLEKSKIMEDLTDDEQLIITIEKLEEDSNVVSRAGGIVPVSSMTSFASGARTAIFGVSAASSNVTTVLNTTSFRVTFSRENLKNNVPVSLPKSSGDTQYQAVLKVDGGSSEIVGGKYNPATGKVEIPMNASGTYVVKENQKDFSDIAGKSQEMQNAIKYLAAKGIISGSSETTFSPDRSITRAEIARLIVTITYKYNKNADGRFTDIPADAWYKSYAGSAKNAGMISGYPDNTFRGNNIITSQQILSIASRTLVKEKRYIYPESTDRFLSKYNDRVSIPNWAIRDIALATREGLVISRVSGNFGGSGAMTRGEAAIILKRLFDKL